MTWRFADGGKAMGETRRTRCKVTVVGAGILGLWQAIELARAGWQVQIIERSTRPFSDTASRHAGAMIAPYCEGEAAPDIVRDYGLKAARLWRERFPDLIQNGSIVVAHARDQSELRRFARMTSGYDFLDAERLARLEPDLSGRFSSALYFSDEAHMATPIALRKLLSLAQAAGAQAYFGVHWDGELTDESNSGPAPVGALGMSDWVIDCRGMAAQGEIANLRGVRGERLLIRSRDVELRRPVRLLHPRQPLYVVPWPNGEFLVGATVVESEATTPVTVRSALELLGLAYALHPGFAEAEILEMDVGVRPAFPDNVPRALVDATQRVVRVNGAYRHGFLLAPVLAQAVAQRLGNGAAGSHPLVIESD